MPAYRKNVCLSDTVEHICVPSAPRRTSTIVLELRAENIASCFLLDAAPALHMNSGKYQVSSPISVSYAKPITMTKHASSIYFTEQGNLAESSPLGQQRTFCFGSHEYGQQNSPSSFGAVREQIMAGAHQVSLPATQDAYLLTLPLVGDVTVVPGPGLGLSTLVGVGELHIQPVPAGSVVQLINPYDTHAISLMQLWLPAGSAALSFAQLITYDAEALNNQLIELAPEANAPLPLPFRISLGQFAGRQQTHYQLKPEATQLSAFVLSGTFELDGQLLHEDDGLTCWDTAAIELEALSDNALLLLVELVP
jgi:hypothetical protein